MTPRRRHAMLDSHYPPAEEIFFEAAPENEISLLLCHGWSRYAIWERLKDIEAIEPGSKALIDAVAAEYLRHVPAPSFDFLALCEELPKRLARRAVSISFGEGWDSSEGAQHGSELARTQGVHGYAYVHQQDLDRVIHTGVLYIGFGSLEPEAQAKTDVARVVVEELDALGLRPEWKGSASERIVCNEVLFEAPLT